MSLSAKSMVSHGHAVAASVASAGRRAAVRERTIEMGFAMSTGEVRLQLGAVAMAAGTPTVDIQGPARVRSWSAPV
jgi:hypothetical protein